MMDNNQSMSIGGSVDSYIAKCAKELLDQTKYPHEPDKMPKTLEEIIRHFLIIHIRYWHIEDTMAQTKSDSEFIDCLSQADHFAKGKRPQLKAVLDEFMLQLCLNKSQLVRKEET